MPFRPMTSERVCVNHPSARSPRTALQAGGGVVSNSGSQVEICNEEGCPDAGAEISANIAKVIPRLSAQKCFMTFLRSVACSDSKHVG
jgi:hypothetical protein